jgi:hypothetical protein
MTHVEMDAETIRRLADNCDGWSILSTQGMIDLGLPESVARKLTEVHTSDRTCIKSTLYVDGEAVDELSGIYSLRLLAYLADVVGVADGIPQAYGRGTMADHYKREIAATLNAMH